MGCSLKHTARGDWPLPESKLHKLSGTKGGLSGPKGVPGPLFKQHSPNSYRQHNSCCLHKQGGMKSGPLCALMWRNMIWCSKKQVILKARHIPGQLNVIADKLSRLGQTIQTEWSLHPEVFQATCYRWHQPQVDLLATKFKTSFHNLS